MGDARFDKPYAFVQGAADPAKAIRSLNDEDVVAALAAASREQNPYLANVLASEAFNRMRRATAVFEHIGEGVMAVTAGGRIVTVNPAAQRLLGASKEEIVGRGLHEVVHAFGPEDAHTEERCPLLACLEENARTFRGDDAFSTMRGETVPVAVTMTPILREGEVDGAVVVFADITERKLAQARIEEQAHVLEQTARNSLRELRARRRADAMLRAALAALPDALLLVDDVGHVILTNAGACALFGALDSELQGMPVEDLLPGATSWLDGSPDRVDVLRRDGSVRAVSVRVVSLEMGEGSRLFLFREAADEAASGGGAR